MPYRALHENKFMLHAQLGAEQNNNGSCSRSGEYGEKCVSVSWMMVLQGGKGNRIIEYAIIPTYRFTKYVAELREQTHHKVDT